LSSSTNVFKNMYIDLDAILDTRLGTLYFLDKGLYDFYKKEGREDYVNRLIDEFEYIPNNVFKYYYRQRNKAILPYSPLTPILEVLNLTIDDMVSKRVMADKSIKKLIIDVNYHPYDLTEKELEQIKLSILSKISSKDFVVINMVNIPYEDLTTKLCGSYGVITMYDATTWLDVRGLKKDVDINIPNTHLILPYSLPSPLVFKSGETLEKYFKNIEELMSYYIKLEYNRVELFSAIN